MMLKKLFLRKSREILIETESAEKILHQVEDKIKKLKEGNKFSLLREEMVKLIRESNSLTRMLNEKLIYSHVSYGETQKQLDDILKSINECLDEMENLSKEKDDAVIQRKESKQ